MVRIVRYWIPAALCLAGIIVAIAGGLDRRAFEIGTPLFAAGLTIFAVSLLVRLTISEEGDRAREQRDRDFYREHGRWPDERRSRPR